MASIAVNFSSIQYSVYQALVLTCSDALNNVDKESNPQAPGEASDFGNHVYMEFLFFWETILKEQTSAMKQRESADKEKFFAIVYDEMMEAVIRLMRELNLAVKDAAEDERSGSNKLEIAPGEEARSAVSSTGDVATLRPLNQKDHILFQNLVDFWQLFLPKTQPQLFSRWVYLMSHSLIELSAKHPLVSGIYKMVGTILRTCEDIGFFKSVRNLEYEANDEVCQIADDANGHRSCGVYSNVLFFFTGRAESRITGEI